MEHILRDNLKKEFLMEKERKDGKMVVNMKEILKKGKKMVKGKKNGRMGNAMKETLLME